MPLTETDIKAIKPHPDRHRWVNDGDGLYLRIAPSDRRTWIWRTKRNGKTSYFTIGEWPELTVKSARAALAKRTGLATLPNALTVKVAAEEWFADQIERRYRVTKNIRTYVDRWTAEFGARRLQELTRAEIARMVRSYAKDAPVAANRCLTNIKLMLGWCVEVGYRDDNPANGLTRRSAGGEEEPRARTLSDDEIRLLWALAPENGNLLRALLLTGCRIAELQKGSEPHLLAGAARIADFRPDLNGEWLRIPEQHSKNGRAHYVYLVPETKKQFNGRSPLLFRAVSPTAVQAFVRRLQIDVDGDEARREPWKGAAPINPETGERMPPWTPHDLRRTFATRLGELGVAPHIIDKLLNHTLEGVSAIYNRAELLEERAAATKRWADELANIVKGAKNG